MSLNYKEFIIILYILEILKFYSDKGFVNIDDGRMGGSHWTGFYIKDHKSYYFDSFGGQPDKFLLNQLPKPIIYLNSKIQDINFKFCGSYCVYFYYLIGKMGYYDAVSKLVFEKNTVLIIYEYVKLLFVQI